VSIIRAYWGGNSLGFCSEQVFSKAVLNVHNLSLAGYCEQDRLSLYMHGGSGGGILTSQTIESEVRLTSKNPYLNTSPKIPPRFPAGQGRIAFGVAPGSDAAAAAGAIVDVDDQDDEAVLVAEQKNQQKEKTQPVLFTEERPRVAEQQKQQEKRTQPVLFTEESLAPHRSLSFPFCLLFLISLDSNRNS